MRSIVVYRHFQIYHEGEESPDRFNKLRLVWTQAFRSWQGVLNTKLCD